MILFWRKIIILLVFVAVIFNFSSRFELNNAQAFRTVWCINCSQAAVQIPWKALEIGRWLKEDLMKALRDVIAKRIIDYIVDQTIVWIQGGGKPQFVTNWQGFINAAGKIAQDEIIRQVGLTPLCSPFKLQVQLSLLPVPKFSRQLECTLDDIVKNIEDFYADFSKGGWIAYNEAWQPQNNYYGQILMIHDEMLIRSEEAKKAAQNEALAGRGFLSIKRCKGGQSQEDYCKSACKATNKIREGGDYTFMTYERCYQNCFETKMTEEELCEASGGKMVIETPGDVVGEVAGRAITSDQEWAQNIQSWISALVNALINRLAKEGLSAIKGSDSSSATYRPTGYDDVLGREFENDKQNMIKEITRFTDEWQYLLNAKNKSLSYVQQANGVLEQLRQIQARQSSLPPACQPLVTDQEIQAVQAEIKRLTNETKDLQVKLDEAKALIEQIKQADFFNIRQRSLAQTAYQQFMDKYNTTELIEQIFSGSARQAANSESQSKQNELAVIQNRFDVCQAAISSE